MTVTATATRIALRTAPTLAQWVGALATAQAHGLPGETVPEGDMRFRVPSKTEPGRRYTVAMALGEPHRIATCGCDAGRSGRICAHQAAVAWVLYARDSGADLGQLMAVPADVLARRLWDAYGPRRAEGRE